MALFEDRGSCVRGCVREGVLCSEKTGTTSVSAAREVRRLGGGRGCSGGTLNGSTEAAKLTWKGVQAVTLQLTEEDHERCREQGQTSVWRTVQRRRGKGEDQCANSRQSEWTGSARGRKKREDMKRRQRCPFVSGGNAVWALSQYSLI